MFARLGATVTGVGREMEERARIVGMVEALQCAVAQNRGGGMSDPGFLFRSFDR